jgi:hypothetical protein
MKNKNNATVAVEPVLTEAPAIEVAPKPKKKRSRSSKPKAKQATKTMPEVATKPIVVISEDNDVALTPIKRNKVSVWFNQKWINFAIWLNK